MSVLFCSCLYNLRFVPLLQILAVHKMNKGILTHHYFSQKKIIVLFFIQPTVHNDYFVSSFTQNCDYYFIKVYKHLRTSKNPRVCERSCFRLAIHLRYRDNDTRSFFCWLTAFSWLHHTQYNTWTSFINPRRKYTLMYAFIWRDQNRQLLRMRVSIVISSNKLQTAQG